MITFTEKQWELIAQEAERLSIPMSSVVRMYFLQGITGTIHVPKFNEA